MGPSEFCGDVCADTASAGLAGPGLLSVQAALQAAAGSSNETAVLHGVLRQLVHAVRPDDAGTISMARALRIARDDPKRGTALAIEVISLMRMAEQLRARLAPEGGSAARAHGSHNRR
jgi:hypothetical protein